MSEKVFLRWGDFHTAASNAFASLREDIYFADVTLACEDGQQIDAHKVVLAASSPIFRNLLRRSKLANPIIFMRGVGSENLEAIVDFIYRGEANVTQENLNSFLAFAQEGRFKNFRKKSKGCQGDVKRASGECQKGVRRHQ